jgi:hypothetical protein
VVCKIAKWAFEKYQWPYWSSLFCSCFIHVEVQFVLCFGKYDCYALFVLFPITLHCSIEDAKVAVV